MHARRSRIEARSLRVLLADDHQVLLEGLVRLLQGHYSIVGTETNAVDLLARARESHPDLIVLDLSMPGGGGLGALRQLVTEGFPGRIVVLTMHADPEVSREALEAGAHGFVLKQSAGAELLEALRAVSAGHVYVSPSIAAMADGQSTGLPIARPSARQRQVLRLLAQGLRTKEIAAELDLSPRTVESHKLELMRALKLDTSAKLIRYAITHGLAD